MALQVKFGFDSPVPNQYYGGSIRQSAYHEVARDTNGTVWLAHSNAKWQVLLAEANLTDWNQLQEPFTYPSEITEDVTYVKSDEFKFAAHPTMGAMLCFAMYVAPSDPTNGVYVRRLDLDGSLLDAPERIGTVFYSGALAGGERGPFAIVGQGDDRFIYVEEVRGYLGASKMHIFAAEYTEDTLAWSSKFLISELTQRFTLSYSSVPDGLFSCEWVPPHYHTAMRDKWWNSGLSISEKWINYIKGDGFTTIPLVTEETLLQQPQSLTYQYDWPVIAVDRNDAEHVYLYLHYFRDDGPDNTVIHYIAERTAAGWGELLNAQEDSGVSDADRYLGRGDIKVDDFGNLHFVYGAMDDQGDFRIYYKSKSAFDGEWSEPIQVSFRGNVTPANPRLANIYDPRTQPIMVFWRDQISGHSDPVYSQQTTWWNVGEIILDLDRPDSIYLLDGNVGDSWCRWKGDE